MLNKHFIRRLFIFVIIVACGAILTLVVNYIENNKPGAVEARESRSLN